MSYNRRRPGMMDDMKVLSAEVSEDFGKHKKKLALGGTLFALVAGVLMGYRPVAPQNLGVVTRLGQYHRTLESGPQVIIPFVEGMRQVDVTTTDTVEIGFRTVEAGDPDKGIPATYRDALNDDEMKHEAQMLTADENIIWGSMVIQYKKEPANVTDYLFNNANVEDTINLVGQAVLRQTVGNYGVDEILTFGRSEIESVIKEEVQETLDLYRCGIDVIDVQLQNTQPPMLTGTVLNELGERATVASEFRDVESKRQDKDRLIQEARGHKNRVETEAMGEASKLVSQAKGTKVTRIGAAQRDTEEFNELLIQYRLDPQGTKYRLYVETMREIYPNLETIIVDEGLIENGGILPLLNLSEGMGEVE